MTYQKACSHFLFSQWHKCMRKLVKTRRRVGEALLASQWRRCPRLNSARVLWGAIGFIQSLVLESEDGLRLVNTLRKIFSLFSVQKKTKNPHTVVELICIFKRASLSPCFPHSLLLFFFFFQVPIYLNSFPLFFFLLHWFPNPSLCMQLGPSCVSLTVYACACVFVWVFSGTVLPQWA